MEVNIKSIHFDATEKLQDFINKKVNRLARHHENISNVEVTLSVVKPETSMNKEAGIKISVPQQEDIFASKTANSFEEAVDLCLEALERQLEKIKGRK
ncbi:MAG: ribosome-associated translation inhibitor RaiA [Muribaculum sp.]